MKRVIALFFVLTVLLPTVYSAPKGKVFTISGKISGLKAGDKLKFFRVVFDPDYAHKPFFEVVAEKDLFFYKGTIEHEEMLVMSYLPADGSKVEADRLGVQLFVRGGDRLRLESDIDRIYFPTVSGGIYNNSFLSDIKRQENELGYLRTTMLRQLNRLRATTDGNSPEVKRATDDLNNYYRNNRKAMMRVDSLYKVYYSSKKGADLGVFNLLARESRVMPYKELCASWEGLSERLRKSRFGTILQDRIMLLQQLQPGEQAPDFSLMRKDSTLLRLFDLRGKYILIYHFGLCPGSIQIDPEVARLDSICGGDSLCVIGLSSMKQGLAKLHSETPGDKTAYGVNMKERLYTMINHPYEDFDMRFSNNDLTELYQIAGLPYFIFISPEGKMIDRGFQRVFRKVKKRFQDTP